MRCSIALLPCYALCLLLCCSARAEIYKSVDEDGVTRYTDTPGDNAEEFVPPSMNAIPMPQWQQPALPAPQPKAFAYKRLAIARPLPEQAIFSNEGILEVGIAIAPGLAPGHTLELLVDGVVMVSRSERLEHRLTGIERGAHLLSAGIRDGDGRLLLRSAPVRIHMKRISSQHGGSSAGPRDRAGRPYLPGPQDERYLPGAQPPPT